MPITWRRRGRRRTPRPQQPNTRRNKGTTGRGKGPGPSGPRRTHAGGAISQDERCPFVFTLELLHREDDDSFVFAWRNNCASNDNTFAAFQIEHRGHNRVPSESRKEKTDLMGTREKETLQNAFDADVGIASRRKLYEQSSEFTLSRGQLRHLSGRGRPKGTGVQSLGPSGPNCSEAMRLLKVTGMPVGVVVWDCGRGTPLYSVSSSLVGGSTTYNFSSSSVTRCSRRPVHGLCRRTCTYSHGSHFVLS